VHQAVQFVPHACFKKLGKEITDMRRAADRNKALAALALMMKKLGNRLAERHCVDWLLNA